jgi:protein kinase A
VGLNPLQTQGLAAAAGQQHHIQQQQQSGGERFDIMSRKLTLGDFQRVRTLGTGTAHPLLVVVWQHVVANYCAHYHFSGTFARVCLVRPSHGTEADRGKVFALKILRKTEGG